jgi:hypothetical protein
MFSPLMLPNQEDPEQLQIRCPSCGQRFKVGSDLRDRMVECGSCEHRFRIDDETILRSKKFYPGERRDPSLDRFARVPHAPAIQPNIQTVSYANEPSPESFEPTAPQKTMAAVVGACGMVIATLLLTLGARRNGALDGFDMTSRFGLAGFAALTGSIMIVYGNPRARMKSLMFSLIASGVLLSLPLFFQEASTPLGSGVIVTREPETPTESKDETSDLAKQIGLEPLIKENALLASNGGSGRAYGVWFRQLRVSNKLLVRDYMIRSTGADLSSSIYPRDGEDWLMVLSGVPDNLEVIAEKAAKVGHDPESMRIHADLGVVEVVVDNSLFVEGPPDKLQDKGNPAFYELNRRELDSIDLERARKAVKRLAEAEPKLYRDDINRRLVQLLKEADPPMLGDICRALMTWSQPDDGKAIAAAVAALQKLDHNATIPPREMISFLVSRRAVDVAPILDKLWAADPTVWEQLFGELGQPIEPLVLQRMENANSSVKHSAMRLLARVGGKASLSAINAARNGADAEMRVLIERAEAAIRARP